LAFVSGKTMEILRRGEPVVAIGETKLSPSRDYQLYPILEKNQPTTIYGPGASAKSLIADFIAVLVQCNMAGFEDWWPISGNVLYLDWEACAEDHARREAAIKKGLGIEMPDTFNYRPCFQPLSADLPTLQDLVVRHNIVLTIIDSQMAATGYGLDAAQQASIYYNALRSLRCTTLTIDHVTKGEWRGDMESVGPYGSVVKYNRSRSQFEVKKLQYPGENVLRLDLIHRKHNEGRLLKTIGMKVTFENIGIGSDEKLDKIIFEKCETMESDKLRDRLLSALEEGGRTVNSLALDLRTSESSVRATLNRYKEDFRKDGDLWALQVSVTRGI